LQPRLPGSNKDRKLLSVKKRAWHADERLISRWNKSRNVVFNVAESGSALRYQEGRRSDRPCGSECFDDPRISVTFLLGILPPVNAS
jgi:hypothetical protein